MAYATLSGDGWSTAPRHFGFRTGACPAPERHHCRAPPAGEFRGAKTGLSPPSRRMKHARACLISVALLVGLVAVPAASFAAEPDGGTYAFWACRTPDGKPAPTDMFAKTYPKYHNSTDTCATGGSLRMAIPSTA